MTLNTLLQGAALAVVVAFPAFADQHTRTTEEVVMAHLGAFGAGDVDAIMEDYADDAVFILPNAVLVGHDQIRPVFEGLVAEFSQPGTEFTLDVTQFNDTIGYIAWHAETSVNVYAYGGDTFIVEDGLITAQTVALSVTPK